MCLYCTGLHVFIVLCLKRCREVSVIAYNFARCNDLKLIARSLLITLNTTYSLSPIYPLNNMLRYNIMAKKVHIMYQINLYNSLVHITLYNSWSHHVLDFLVCLVFWIKSLNAPRLYSLPTTCSAPRVQTDVKFTPNRDQFKTDLRVEKIMNLLYSWAVVKLLSSDCKLAFISISESSWYKSNARFTPNSRGNWDSLATKKWPNSRLLGSCSARSYVPPMLITRRS